MSVKELQEWKRISGYARYNHELGRRETWNEQIERVMTMHREKYAHINGRLEPYLKKVESAMKKKLVLGSQRALQFGGQAILDKNARLYNCTVSYVDRPRFFQECMWLLLCGCGAGFSVQKHHVANLPPIKFPNGKKVKHRIDDSIEGWSDAIGILLSSYFDSDETPFPEFRGKRVEFDFSEIRPEGALIKSSGCKAPGPNGLKNALAKIEELLDKITTDGQTTLKPIDAYDVVMHTSDAVLSGGVRRSATICLFSPDDEEMLKAKTGNWFIDNPQRGRSNNSVLLVRKDTTKKQFNEIMKSVKEFGEPGFVFAEDTEALYNPCVEIGMYAKDEQGNSGWSFCNLCEMNPKKAKTEEEFIEMCEFGAILGTLQAGYTDFSYLGEVTENIVRREALLGVSMTGMMDNAEIALDPEIQKKGANHIRKINKKIASILGINQAARTTCVKPAGSTSCILGTASGIHPHHSTRYFRRVQVNKLEEPLKFFREYNPMALEESVWSNNNTDEVITFCCEVPRNVRTKVNTDGLQLLEFVKLTQQNWVTYGKNKELCTQPWLSHNVSNTIHVKENEWDTIADYIYNNRRYFAGISLLPMDGDKDYPQAPFTTVYTPDQIVKEYGDGSLMASGLIVDGLRAFDDDLWSACSFILGFGEKLDMPSGLSKKQESAWKRQVNYNKKTDWERRAKQFAKRYFDDDLRKMTYCLKDCYNWKLWCDLTREYKEVPWVEFKEETDNTKVNETVACAGGKCDLTLNV